VPIGKQALLVRHTLLKNRAPARFAMAEPGLFIRSPRLDTLFVVFRTSESYLQLRSGYCSTRTTRPHTLSGLVVFGFLIYAARCQWNQFHDERALAPANHHGGGNPSQPRSKKRSVKRRPTVVFSPNEPAVPGNGRESCVNSKLMILLMRTQAG
jgi:hypothetical protein